MYVRKFSERPPQDTPANSNEHSDASHWVNTVPSSYSDCFFSRVESGPLKGGTEQLFINTKQHQKKKPVPGSKEKFCIEMKCLRKVKQAGCNFSAV